VSDFGIHSNPTARKEHRCEWCGQKILKGEKHFQFVGKWQGEFQNWRMHLECEHVRCIECDYDDGFTPFENDRPEKEFSESEESTPVDRTYKADTHLSDPPSTT
jgi:hypothetical protein